MDKKKQHRIWVYRFERYIFPLIILGLAVHLLIPQITSMEHSVQVIQQMKRWAFALAGIAQVFSYLGSGYLLITIVRLSGGKLSIFKATSIVLAAYSLGVVAGGMVGSTAATYRWIKKEGGRAEAANLAGMIPSVINSMGLVLISVAGIIHLLIKHQLSRLQVFSFTTMLSVLSLLIGILVWGFRHRPGLIRFAHRIGGRVSRIRRKPYHPEKTEGWVVSLFNAWDLLAQGGWRGPVVGEILNVAFDMLTLYFLFIAAGNPTTLGVIFTGYGLPLLLGKLAFILPGGVGVVEGTMVALYDNLGIPDPVTVVVVLAYRMLSFWLPLIIGFPLIGLMRRGSKSEDNDEVGIGLENQ